MNQKNVVAILGIAIVILLGTTIYFAIISNVNQPGLVAQQSQQAPVNQLQNNSNQPQPAYKNEKYGFSLALPGKWGNYKTSIENTSRKADGEAYLTDCKDCANIHFLFPINDENESTWYKNETTGQVEKGHFSAFAIGIEDVASWNSFCATQMCKDEPGTPGCLICSDKSDSETFGSRKISANGKYVFYVSTAQDPPEEWKKTLCGSGMCDNDARELSEAVISEVLKGFNLK